MKLKIRIFTGPVREAADLERRVNRFIKDKYVVAVQQSVCCNACGGAAKEMVMTVTYYDHYCYSYCNTQLR